MSRMLKIIANQKPGEGKKVEPEISGQPNSQSVDSKTAEIDSQQTIQPSPVDSHSATKPVDHQAVKPLDPQTNQQDEFIFSPVTVRDKSFKSRQGVKIVSFRMIEDRKRILKSWCVRADIDFQDFILEAIYEKATGLVVDFSTGQTVEWTANQHDDFDNVELMINDDKPLSIYRRLTGNRVRQSDKDFAAEVSTIAPTFIEAGIILSIIRAASKDPPSRVNSFRYCLGAIDETCHQQKGTIESYLNYLKKKQKDLNL